ncbi:MAG: FAD-dependent oxidoreductase [Bacteroidia bacterium]
MEESKDCLIVGQGIAGTLMAYRLIRAGYSLAVVDPGHAQTSSRVAAGMYTPVSGKRMALTPDVGSLLYELYRLYPEMETFLDTEFLHRLPIYHAFATVKEQNDLMSRLDEPGFAHYVNADPQQEPGVIEPFGAFEVKESGWVDLPCMLDAFRKHVEENHLLLEEELDYDQIKRETDGFSYHQMHFRQIVFCEGYLVRKNPFFKEMQIIPCKGDVLEIRSTEAPQKRIVKKGCYMVHIRDDEYRVGSTYEWGRDDEEPTPASRELLESKLNELMEIKYDVFGHTCGIRPTTRTREPIIAVHPELKGMYALNGLGAKGVMHGPLESLKLVQRMMAEGHSTSRV